MTDQLPPCPSCASDLTYENGALLTCPMCGHEWTADEAAAEADAPSEPEIRDSAGNVLADGDTVIVSKNVRIQGAGGGTLKAGTKVNGIRLNPGGPDGHDIDARVPGFGRMQLKSSVVKKA